MVALVAAAAAAAVALVATLATAPAAASPLAASVMKRSDHQWAPPARGSPVVFASRSGGRTKTTFVAGNAGRGGARGRNGNWFGSRTAEGGARGGTGSIGRGVHVATRASGGLVNGGGGATRTTDE